MSPIGGVEPEYLAARRVLLDALEVLQPQRESVRLVGAQAIYLHTQNTSLAVAPFTVDGDIALEPSALKLEPPSPLGLEDLYIALYPIWSETSHASGVMKKAVVDRDAIFLDGLRHPNRIQTVTAFAIEFGHQATRRMTSKYLPDRLAEYEQWYELTIRKDHEQLRKKEIIRIANR